MAGRKAIDLTGCQFGRLIALERSYKARCGATTWLCVCECGNMKRVHYSNLVTGKTKSCGCLNRERRVEPVV